MSKVVRNMGVRESIMRSRPCLSNATRTFKIARYAHHVDSKEQKFNPELVNNLGAAMLKAARA